MKKVLGAAAVAATLLVGSTVASQAVTLPLYQFPSRGGFTYGNVDASGTLNDQFDFGVKRLTKFTASLTNSTKVIANLVLSLFTSNNTLVSTTTIGTPSDMAGNQNRGIGATIGAGNYYIKVSGTAQDGTSYTGNISLSAVPLPGTVALFGTAVAALGVAGAMGRKRKAVAAV